MKVEYLPILQLQRDLYDIPRGPQRFQQYLNIVQDGKGGMGLPLAMLNPMGKEHVPALFDQLLAMDTDGMAYTLIEETAKNLAAIDGDFRIVLTIADDAGGGWTNRYDWEFKHRFETRPFHRHGWLVSVLWSADELKSESVREELLTTVYRGAYIQQHGYADTLDEMLNQEAYALGMAGVAQWMDADEVAYSAEVLAPFLDDEDRPIQLVCFYGDPAAHNLGLPLQGLSERAGFAVALHRWNQAC